MSLPLANFIKEYLGSRLSVSHRRIAGSARLLQNEVYMKYMLWTVVNQEAKVLFPLNRRHCLPENTSLG